MLLLLALVHAGCATTPAIRSESSPAADFAGYRTYAWISPRSAPLSPPPVGQTLTGLPDWRIRNAVDTELGGRGWTESITPDVLVGYGIVIEDANTESFSDYARYVQQGGRAGLGEAFVKGYQKGTLILVLYEAGTGQLVWRAAATAVVDSTAQGELARQAVQQMLSQLPRQ